MISRSTTESHGGLVPGKRQQRTRRDVSVHLTYLTRSGNRADVCDELPKKTKT